MPRKKDVLLCGYGCSRVCGRMLCEGIRGPLYPFEIVRDGAAMVSVFRGERRENP